jgi:predicted RNA methylase
MKIENEIADILGNSIIEGNNLYLPEGQLERNLYLKVNKVLEAIHGKWDRKEKAHVFDKSPSDILEEILLAGEYTDQKKEYQFFETPEKIALKLIEMANIQNGETILEPSAGKGAIAKFIKGCDCVEINEENRKYLIENNFNLVGKDFLEFNNKYDVIIANPPFTKQQDILHVEHMLDLAKHRVVSVMSSSVLFRTNKKTEEFRKRINRLGGIFTGLPEKSFAESGTNVNACILYVDLKKVI